MNGMDKGEQARPGTAPQASPCPSCHDTGWATIRAGNITVAGGRCECVGGKVWASPESRPGRLRLHTETTPA